MKKKTGLGRGLGALLEDTPPKERISGEGAAPRDGINEIDINIIEVNPFQPRTDFNQEALNELAESIKAQGIIQPITVRKLNDNAFQLISGERRLQASKIAGLEKIPSFIRKADDQQMLEMALIENIQRENLNSIEVALSYQRLIAECDLKQEELAKRVGKNRATVNNYLRLLKLPPDIQIALRDGKLSMGHARTLINIENVDLQLDIFNKIVAEELSVRKAEELVRESAKPKPQKKESQKSEIQSSPEMKQLQDKLSSHFGTKIKVATNSKDKGEIKIPYYSVEDLNRILEILEV
ncbi:MAG TPA: ParB/RepB/Spo0J family partition protein [Cyclobacteriaceae bacterium]